jgi:nicotinate (nicotinamide) nucleotide adenylyltransferase
MAVRLALFGGSFDPPGIHHLRIAEALARRFDRVLVVPCGPRPDKASMGELEREHRSRLVELTFPGIPGVDVDLFDLGNSRFTTTIGLVERFASQAEVWLVVGTDLLLGGREGRSPIQRYWYRGRELWQSCRFAVVRRAGVAFASDDLPPTSTVVDGEFAGSSTEVRERRARGEDITGLVTEEVRRYILRHGLYA